MKNGSAKTTYTDDPHLARLLFQAGAGMPSLRAPIDAMRQIPDPSIGRIGTDGLDLYIGDAPEALSPADIEHLLLHCLFRHMLPPEQAVIQVWDLACDMAAEYLRTEICPDGEARHTRRSIRGLLPGETDPRDAGSVYGALMDLFEEDLEPLTARFRRDDHRYWYTPAAVRDWGGAPGAETFTEENEDIPYEARLEAALAERWPAGSGQPEGSARTNLCGLSPGSREEKMLLRERGKYDFSRYLRRFSTTREEAVLDLGSFDYIPYYYGLQRYGRMPFIEPLEYSENHKVEELVIAIDTSGSCSRQVVERFLGEIERILMQRDFFFQKMNVHIIQCDAAVRAHARIRSYDEWKKYLEDLTVKGRGGTDFRPVFTLVEELIRKGELKDLKGLLYFTDGRGVFPTERTPYETAFVFSSKSALELKIPEWIIPLCLEKS